MTLRRPASALALVIALLVSALGTVVVAGPAPAAAPAPRAEKPAVYWSLGNPVSEPKRIFEAYSSSPYLKALRWKHWGERVTVGRGVYISDCASCSPPARRTATIRLSGFVSCAEDRSVRSYRKAVVTVSEPDEGETATTWEIFAGCP